MAGTWRRLRRGAAAAALVGLGAAMLVVVPAGRSASAGQRAAGRPGVAPADRGARLDALTLPADCKPSGAGPPVVPYQLGTVLQIGHPPGTDPTVADGSLSGGAVSVSGIAASLCGVVTVVAGPSKSCPVTASITVPADGQSFVPLTAILSLVAGQPLAVPFRVVPRAITAALGCGPSLTGLVVNFATTIEGSTGLFGVACLVPGAAHLSTVLTSPSGSFSDFRGTATGSITLPGASVSPTCPQSVVTNLDTLAGLPLAAQVTLPAKAALYLPGSPP
jgi:hypothetical protein